MIFSISGLQVSEKFFGISVQKKKDIVAIITKRENKESIMKAISQSFDGENKAIVFSLPVDNVFGIAQRTAFIDFDYGKFDGLC